MRIFKLKKNGKVKEYYYNSELRFEGEYLNGKILNGKIYDNNDGIIEIKMVMEK